MRSSSYTMPAVNVRGAFIRRTDLSGADLTGADLSGADASGALFRGADFKDARLAGTVLNGADLTDARNLTEAQLASAVIDEHTRLPAYIDRTRLLEAIGAVRPPTNAQN